MTYEKSKEALLKEGVIKKCPLDYKKIGDVGSLTTYQTRCMIQEA